MNNAGPGVGHSVSGSRAEGHLQEVTSHSRLHPSRVSSHTKYKYICISSMKVNHPNRVVSIMEPLPLCSRLIGDKAAASAVTMKELRGYAEFLL